MFHAKRWSQRRRLDFAQAPKSLRHIASRVRNVSPSAFGLAFVDRSAARVFLIGRSRLIEDMIMTPLEVLRPDSWGSLDSLGDSHVSDGRAKHDLYLFPRRDLSHSP